MTEEEKQIREIEKGLEKTLKEVGGMKDQLKDMFKVPEFKQMEQSISQLKDLVKPDNPHFGAPTPKKKTNINTTPPPIDGETCMHGNSWHSNCSECDDLDDMEIALNEMGNIIDTEPNDKELGKKIRDFYNNWLDLIDGRRKIDVD
tara:strand:+ start:57 stop:494 length:438 start_codon:yes stop_codon:yes gene_type:complete